MHTNQPIIFDHSDLNIGNAYSPQYGSFTAPRPGVYVFNVNLLPHVSVTDARVVKNGQILAKTHSERWKQSSQTVIVELQLGDHVSVNIDYQSNVSLYHDAYCTFSGFLLYDFTDTDALAVGKWALTCDFQHCGILTSVDLDEPVQPRFKVRNPKWCAVHMELNSRIIFKRLAKALNRLRQCAGWSEALLVALTTLLEISCRGSNKYVGICIRF